MHRHYGLLPERLELPLLERLDCLLIQALPSPTTTWTSACDDHVTKLAGEFKVSKQAMTIRLSTLGYL